MIEKILWYILIVLAMYFCVQANIFIVKTVLLWGMK